MSVASTSKCVFCTFARSARQIPSANRTFSSSPSQLNRKPKFASVKAPKARLNKVPTFKPEYLEEHFTPEQRAAIQAANKVINNDSIKSVGKRKDPWSMNYVDNLTEIDPAIDHAVKAPWENVDDKMRLKTDDDFTDDLHKFMYDMPMNSEKAEEAWMDFDQNLRLTVGKEEAEREARTAMAPELPRLSKKPAAAAKGNSSDGPPVEMTPALLRLMQMTGLTAQQIIRLRVKVLVSHSVTNQTRLGKIQKAYCMAVAGNENGYVGLGEGKSEEFGEALIQAQYRAIRNMQPVKRYENRTIFGDVDGKVSATELELFARPPGFGLRCQQYIYEICRAAGISDLAARVTRSRNPMNTVKATMQALLSQKDPEEIAKARGKKLVDVRKVYYAGRV